MAAGSGPVARDHQAWKRVEELAEAVAALRAAPEGFVLVPVQTLESIRDSSTDPVARGFAEGALAARPQGVNHG